MGDSFSRFQDRYLGGRSVVRYLMVTVILVGISVLTAVVSQVGSQLDRVDVLFFSSLQGTSENVEEKVLEEYNRLVESGEENIGEEAVMAMAQKFMNTSGSQAFQGIQQGQIWRLVTPMFIHMNLLHIVFNMMWLWQFGVFLESRFGSWKYLGMVLVFSAVANIVQAWFVGVSFGGMSGVNYGMFGFLMMRSWLHPDPGYKLRKELVAWMLIWLVVCMTGRMGPVANHAHVGGFLCGGIFGSVHALRAGAWSILRRRAEFRSAYAKREQSLYVCAVCGATEVSHPERTFAVCPADGKDYCDLHMPAIEKKQNS
jgi:membrane associated rhomboid family serine protease